ncbi:MAG TPA: Rv3235 family protein [Egibacteraceae bacterium]|nr:Rv3235 family protein [Egibacteraceae bacterium]
MPTDEQLADILRFVARTCLEVERGLRPPVHLASLMDPTQRSIQPGQLGRFGGGPVQNDHIGRPQISRLTDTHIVATVVTRTEGDRWGALTLKLRAHGGRLRVVDLQRLLAVAHYRTPPTTRVAVPSDNTIQHIAEARRMVAAAHEATAQRLAELTPDAPGYRAARDLVRHWQRKLGELDRQLVGLKTRQQTRDHAEPVLRR